MRKTCKYIGISVVIGTILVYATIVVLKEFEGGEWHKHTFPEYKFRETQTRKEFKDWIAMVPMRELPFEDFDLCYMPWNDTIWDRTYRNVVDTFNLRLHTHRLITNFFRTEDYYSRVKGVCRLNTHWIYLYDDITIDRFFTPTGRSRSIRSFMTDEHYFLQGTDDESIYVAQAKEHIRPINTQECKFFEGYNIFFFTKDFTDYTLFHNVIEKDSFYYRSSGPYFVLSLKDTLSFEETQQNFKNWIMANISPFLLDSITEHSRVSIHCFVDTNGNFSFDNYSSIDLKDDVTKLVLRLPKFIPAMERGIPVNSIINLRCYPFYEIDHEK